MSDQVPDPVYVGEWWDTLPSVDGEPARLTREPEMIPDEEGLKYLEELGARLEERAKRPDVQEFIERSKFEDGA